MAVIAWRRVKLRIKLAFLEDAKNRQLFQQLLKTQVILVLNFTPPHVVTCYIQKEGKTTQFLRTHKTSTVSGRGHHSRTLLNWLRSFFRSPPFFKTFFLILLAFSILPINSSIYSSWIISKRYAIVTDNFLATSCRVWAVARQSEDHLCQNRPHTRVSSTISSQLQSLENKLFKKGMSDVHQGE